MPGFRKLAQAQALGYFTTDAQGSVRLAQLNETPAILAAGAQPALQVHKKSYYVDGARTLDVQGLLDKVADLYAISRNPTDYFFEAIRANTTNCPNENNDGFHQRELLRYDVRLGMPVYFTYSGKPHHLNHKADNPKLARGVIIDSHYNSDSPPLENCPSCNKRTAEVQNRDETGLHCKCGALVKDEFVEILVAIDAKKDPFFAENVRKGVLKAGSMGCNCLSTTCNVCSHVAYARPEFCEHIKAGNKGTLWKKAREGWVKTSASEISKELRRRKLAWAPADFCFVKAGDFEARKAFEYCNQVIFDEYSRVDQPADPKALQVEVLNLRAASFDNNGVPSPEMLRAETEALIRSAEKKRREFEAHVKAAQMVQPGQPQAQAPYGLERRRPPMHPGMMDQHGVGIQLEPGDDPVVIEPPGQGDPQQQQQQPGAPGAPPQPMGIDQYTDQQVQAPGQQPPGNESMDMGEMGVLPIPPGAAAPRHARRPMNFKSAYTKWTVQVSNDGNARILTPAPQKEPVLVLKASKPIVDPAARKAFAVELIGHLCTHGLVRTAQKYNAIFSPRFAQVVEGGMNDMVNFKDHYQHDSVLEGGATQNFMQPDLRGKPPADTRVEMELDMAGDVRGTPPGETGQGGAMDHKHDDENIQSVTEGKDKNDMRDKNLRPPFNMGKDNVLRDGVHDHVLSLTSKSGEKTQIGLGQKMASKADPETPFVVSGFLMRNGALDVLLQNDELKRYDRLAAADLMEKWLLLDKVSTVKVPGQAAVNTPTTPVVAAAKCAKCGADGEHTCAYGDKEAALVAREAAVEKREKLAAAKLAQAQKAVEKAKVEAATLESQLKEAAVGSFSRALRIVAKRGAADLEAAPLKQAAEAVLSEPRYIGKDAATGDPIPYQGLDAELTRYLVAEMYELGHADHLEHLIKRASDLMGKGDAYLIDAEADLKNFAAPMPVISNLRTAAVDEAGLHASEMRRLASRGNLQFTPAPSDDPQTIVPSNGHDKRAAIRGALGGTVVEAARGRLGLN